MDANKTQTQVDFFKDMFDSPEEKKALRDFSKRRLVVSKLASLRTAKGLTQADFAKQTNCTQGTISKLEAGADATVTLENLEAYAEATGTEITILISDRGKSLADQIKHHAFNIRAAFMKLVNLAHKDDLIAQGVAKLHGEAFFNINNFLAETAQQLLADDNGRPLIQIVSQATILDECDATSPNNGSEKPPRRTRKKEKVNS